MKFLSLAIIFSLTIFTFGRSICCERCGSSNVLEIDTVIEEILNEDEGCSTQEVCQFSCGNIVPGCQRNLYFQFEQNHRLTTMAFLKNCVIKSQQEDDFLWKKVTIFLTEKYPTFYKENFLDKGITSFKNLDGALTAAKKEKWEFIFASLVQLVRNFKKVCAQTQDKVGETNIEVGRIFDPKWNLQVPQSVTTDEDKMKYMENNLNEALKVQITRPFNRIKRDLFNFVAKLNQNDVKFYNELKEGLITVFNTALQNTEELERSYCSCDNFEPYVRNINNIVNSNPQGYVMSALEFSMRFTMPKTFPGSELEDKATKIIKDDVNSFYKNLVDRKIESIQKCKELCAQ